MSSVLYIKAKELLAAGAIGPLNMVAARWDRNSVHRGLGLHRTSGCIARDLRLAALSGHSPEDSL